MKSLSKFCLGMTLLIFLAGCGKSPGPLEGEWNAIGPLPFKVVFRHGETEAMGMIEHVSYHIDGNIVTVTYTDGVMKGAAIRYTMVDRNTAKNPMVTLKRIR
ncbi:MAG: hypothetical protein Q7K26_01410 [bacterium]|nr:hypothetical protein [bacterium]